MILHVYNIRDERVGEYGTPIFAMFDDDQMVANYEKTVKESLANISRALEINPQQAAELQVKAAQLRDCALFRIGDYDTETGKFTELPERLVCRVADFFPGKTFEV